MKKTIFTFLDALLISFLVLVYSLATERPLWTHVLYVTATFTIVLILHFAGRPYKRQRWLTKYASFALQKKYTLLHCLLLTAYVFLIFFIEDKLIYGYKIVVLSGLLSAVMYARNCFKPRSSVGAYVNIADKKRLKKLFK